jgi:hypothetical protein
MLDQDTDALFQPRRKHVDRRSDSDKITDLDAYHDELISALERLSLRMTKLETAVKQYEKAFTLNDLGGPDIDGHRVQHIKINGQGAVYDQYKKSVTKTIISWLSTGILIVFGLGLIEFIKNSIK